MTTARRPNPTVSAFVTGVELTDSLPRLPLQTVEPDVRALSRRMNGFLLQSLRNIELKKRGGRNSRRMQRTND